MPNPMLWRQLPRGLVLWHTHILAIQNVELPKGLGGGDRRTLPVSVSQFKKKQNQNVICVDLTRYAPQKKNTLLIPYVHCAKPGSCTSPWKKISGQENTSLLSKCKRFFESLIALHRFCPHRQCDLLGKHRALPVTRGYKNRQNCKLFPAAEAEDPARPRSSPRRPLSGGTKAAVAYDESWVLGAGGGDGCSSRCCGSISIKINEIHTIHHKETVYSSSVPNPTCNVTISLLVLTYFDHQSEPMCNYLWNMSGPYSTSIVYKRVQHVVSCCNIIFRKRPTL